MAYYYTQVSTGFDMDRLDFGRLPGLEVVYAESDGLSLSSEDLKVRFFGTGLTFGDNYEMTGGTITGLLWKAPGGDWILEDINVPATTFMDWIASGDTATALATLLAGANEGFGSDGPDLLRGFDGNDTLSGYVGNDSIFGGAGNDVISSGGYNTMGHPWAVDVVNTRYLRGEEGNDTITGAKGFDDLHGNQGDDLLHGGDDGDWVVGGKDNDRLFGDGGHDVVWGNLGNDTCEGGTGNDQVRGGQADDVLRGGDGDDWMAGDRGSDTLTGGAGRDIFHTFDGAGLDRVSDFSAADGDRVNVLPGNSYSVAQVGADVVVTVQGAEGGQMVLVNVQLSSLQYDWIFSG